MDYKNGKWAKKIIDIQLENGSWGYFHTQYSDSILPITTEQALRRLEILGFTSDDKPIRKALKYMHNCLIGKIVFPDRKEKFPNWEIGKELMLATWIKIFNENDNVANDIAKKWVEIINSAFMNKKYNPIMYKKSYIKTFGIKSIHENISMFYIVSLITNLLDKNIEKYYFKYILENNNGIYYIYDKIIKSTPECFIHKNINSYLRAIELLAKYNNPECKKQLQFVIKWLNNNKIDTKKWDMGKVSKDGINFPLSDSWKTDENRINDCTYRIRKILRILK
ncbi:MAG: hypothetical protein FWD47_11170 [Treponema sp.]|nr:hypothetical protein [Treponema sp.]